MKTRELALVHPLLDEVAQLAARGQKGGMASADELARLRTDLRKKLVQLRTDLGTTLTEREVYLALFPLVVLIDEIVQTTLVDVGRASWQALQKEFFETDKGGDLFYSSLEDLLEVTQASPFVYQLYGFCLSLGFRGKYVEDPDRVAQYQRRLANKLQVASPPPTAPLPPPPDPGRLKNPPPVAWYYAIALGVVLLVYVLFDAAS